MNGVNRHRRDVHSKFYETVFVFAMLALTSGGYGRSPEMRTSPRDRSVQYLLVELARSLDQRFADLLLFSVTSMALVFLFLLTPGFGIVGWLYVLQHLLVLGFAVTRSEPRIGDNSVRSNIAVGVAYLCPYAQVICLYFWPGKAAWPEGGLLLTSLAAVFSVVCLFTIGKRFGVRPALRGLVTRGPYRLVRHPLYLSYVIAAIGFNLQMRNPATLLLVAVGWAAMVYRIVAEERVVSNDPSWPAYVAAVRYRLLPGIW
jgi:protein-S-isoprenylcysteine O-methyltransferase Ste14